MPRLNRPLRLGRLESREVPAVALTDGVLRIDGTARHDVADVTAVAGDEPVIRVTLNRAATHFPAAAVRSIAFNGLAGNDTLRVNASVTAPVIASGGAGSDKLAGGSGPDVLRGGAGVDRLLGEGGDDRLYGGAQADSLYGGVGDDTLVSLDDATADTLFGDAGRDSYWLDQTGRAKDRVVGAAPNEAVNAHAILAFENGADRTLEGDRIADPADGANYQDLASRPRFPDAGPAGGDNSQGRLADCRFLATLSGAAHAEPNVICQRVVDLGDGTYAAVLGGRYYRMDADLPTRRNDPAPPSKVGLGPDGSLWPAILEKAMCLWMGASNTYASMAYDAITTALRGLGAPDAAMAKFKDYDSPAAILDDIDARLSAGQVVGVGINTRPAGVALVEGHASSAVAALRDDAGTAVSVILRNPWGIDGVGHDGYVTISADRLAACRGSVSWGTLAG